MKVAAIALIALIGLASGALALDRASGGREEPSGEIDDTTFPSAPPRDRAASRDRAGSVDHARSRDAARIEWRRSVAIGAPESGRLARGVRLPAQGRDYFTWDPVLKRQPNRDWRRWGTDELVRTTLRVIRRFHALHPRAPRLGVGDLSLPEGGSFGPEVSGGIGHATHQNGLDVDVYYPRVDRRERPPKHPDQVDVGLSQDLLDLFIEAGAALVYSGPSLPLEGPPEIVQPLVNHDNHLHVRIAG
jgi:hypothetical protein